PAQNVVLFGVRTNVLDWCGPRPLLEKPRHTGSDSMTFGTPALLLRPPIDRFALLREHCVDRKRPFRRTDLLYQPLERVQPMEVRRVLVQVVKAEQVPPILLRTVDGKHPVDLAQIAGQ